MCKRFYVDTSVWRDFLEDRSDGLKPLGEFAFQFLKKCLKEKAQVVFSGIVLKELLPVFSEAEIAKRLFEFKEIIVDIDCSSAQKREAVNFWLKTGKRFPYSDVLHAIIARDNNAVLVSRDRHFWEIGIVECVLPEEAL